MKLKRLHWWDLLGLLSLALLVCCVWLWLSSYSGCDTWIVVGERASVEGSRWYYGATTDPGRLTLFRVLNLSDEDEFGRATHYTEPLAARSVGGDFDASLTRAGFAWSLPFWSLVLLTAGVPVRRAWKFSERPVRRRGFEVRQRSTGEDK